MTTNITEEHRRVFETLTYMLATRMRDQMTDAGDEEKLNELINEARELQDSLLKKPSH